MRKVLEVAMNDQHKQPPPLSEPGLKNRQEEVLAKLKDYLLDEDQDSDTIPEDVKESQRLLETLVRKGELAGEIKRLKSPNGLYLFCVGGRLIDAAESYLVEDKGRLIVKSKLPKYCVDFAASHYTLKPLSEIMADISKVVPRQRGGGITDENLLHYTEHYLGMYPIKCWDKKEVRAGYFQYSSPIDPNIFPFQNIINIRVPYWSSDFAANYPNAIFQCCFRGHDTMHAFTTLGGVVVEQIKDAVNNIFKTAGIARVFVPCSEKKPTIDC